MKGDSDIMWAVDVDGNEHYFYIPNSASATDIALVSPRIAIPSSRAILTLQHSFQFNVNDEFGEPFFDGGIVEDCNDMRHWSRVEGRNVVVEGWICDEFFGCKFLLYTKLQIELIKVA